MRKAKEGTQALITLRDMILTGKLPAGERLVELVLVERLRISRTPIRAALARLAEEGLLENSGGGYSVRRFTAKEIRDAIHVRAMMEGLAARTAAERGASPPTLARAHKCVADMEPVLKSRRLTQANIEAYIAINEAFHANLVDMADSFVIRRAVEQACALPFASPNAFVIARRKLGDIMRVLFLSQEQHRALLNAIENREGARAEALAREHAMLAMDALRFVLDASLDVRKVPALRLMVAGGR